MIPVIGRGRLKFIKNTAQLAYFTFHIISLYVRPLKSSKNNLCIVSECVAMVHLQMLHWSNVHGGFVCSLLTDGRFLATGCSVSSSLPPPPPRSWARRAGRGNWSVWVLVKVMQLVHAVAAEMLVEWWSRSFGHRLVGGLRHGDRCVFLAHVQQLISCLVHLLFADSCYVGQLSSNTARVDVAKQTFRRQHLHHHIKWYGLKCRLFTDDLFTR